MKDLTYRQFFDFCYLCIIMKTIVFTLLALFIILPGCTKKETIRTSGTDTIDNTVYQSTTYYAFGFSFSQAKKISNLVTPWPDIVLFVNNDNPVSRLTLQTENFKPSFYKLGDYPDAATAISAFNNLKTVGAYQWVDMADPVADNQVWVYRSNSEYYAKIRIISTVIDKTLTPVYGKCTFEWLYQPEGSLTFPGK
jgi:hypothetical protein